MSELQLVLEIEKYPCLYNFKLPEYSRKDITDRSWRLISENRGLSGMINQFDRFYLGKVNTFFWGKEPFHRKLISPLNETDFIRNQVINSVLKLLHFFVRFQIKNTFKLNTVYFIDKKVIL